ncbi:hypothetical protein ACIRPT_27015 [Streptomyces sp. NPDC101227]|uniref:hypothetical protein n=1 Tax=Streptomyces sp. NPDC101227 TaxID=3366136 RepID=UPI0038301A7A
MSRMAQLLVLARYEDEVMEPLTRVDETRTWRGCFERIPDWFVGGWYLDFFRESQRRGVLADLEALPWNNPECVQVMLHDEDDDASGCGCSIRRGFSFRATIRTGQRTQDSRNLRAGPSQSL